jgi:hypothetical protein
MRYLVLFNVALFVVLTGASPQHASAKGTPLIIADDVCTVPIPSAATFSTDLHKYTLTGTCNLVHTSLRLPIQVPYTAMNAYNPKTGETWEDINVPPPAINQPSRPYGRFQSKMRCNVDPWLNAKIQYQDPNIKCDQIQTTATPPWSAYGPGRVGDYMKTLFYEFQTYGQPRSSWMTEDNRTSLNAQYQSSLAAEKKAAQLRQGATVPSGAVGAYTALIHPSVVTPTSGQIVYSRSAVSIKLAPPKGWTVTGYTINIQRRDANGTWVNHTTIPINAATAHSPSGYTGFGGGAPPAFLMLPGKWRLNAQASSPKMSGVSDWVEFNAIFTSDSTTLKKKRLY